MQIWHDIVAGKRACKITSDVEISFVAESLWIFEITKVFNNDFFIQNQARECDWKTARLGN